MKRIDFDFHKTFLCATLGWCFYYPYASIQVYFSVALLFLFLSFLFAGGVRIDKISKVIGVLFFINIFGLFVRLFIAEDALRDSSEAIRWLFVLLFAFYLNSNLKKNEYLSLIVISVFVVVNALVSWMQYAQISWADFVTKIYGSETHIDASLGISSRALGLSAGPGQNGATAIIFGIYAFVMFYFKYHQKIISFVLLLLTFLTTLLSQSQTSFGALIGGIFLVLILGRVHLPRRLRIHNGYIFVVVASLGFLFYRLIEDLRYLDTLFTFGLGRSSYQGRELKWAEFFEQANENPWLYFIGHGKSYFGLNSGAMDSEYVFVLMIYGVVTFVVLYGLLVWSLMLAYSDVKKGSGEALAYVGVVSCGLISAWPNTFLTDGRIAVILLISLYVWKDNRRVLKLRSFAR